MDEWHTDRQTNEWWTDDRRTDERMTNEWRTNGDGRTAKRATHVSISWSRPDELQMTGPRRRRRRRASRYGPATDRAVQGRPAVDVGRVHVRAHPDQQQWRAHALVEHGHHQQRPATDTAAPSGDRWGHCKSGGTSAGPTAASQERRVGSAGQAIRPLRGRLKSWKIIKNVQCTYGWVAVQPSPRFKEIA